MTIMSIETVSRPYPEWDFGDRIRKVRRSIAQMDQQQMADTLGVTRQVYAAWEAGRTKPTDIVAIAKRVADCWPNRVTASWVLGVEDEQPAPPPRPPGAFPEPQPTRAAIRRLQPVADVTEDRRLDLVPTGLDAVDDDALNYVRLADDQSSLLPRVDSNHQPFDDWVPDSERAVS